MDIQQHGVPDGSPRVVTEEFFKEEGCYGNLPMEGVLEIQALGVELQAKLVELTKAQQGEKKGSKPFKG